MCQMHRDIGHVSVEAISVPRMNYVKDSQMYVPQACDFPDVIIDHLFPRTHFNRIVVN